MRRIIAAEALVTAAASGTLYLRTLAPGVGSGDSGELILAAESLGVPHPPGYPLWTLLARAAAALPMGTLAWRVNALSAILAAIAVGLLYALGRRVGAGRIGSAAAAALFACSVSLWSVAVEAEVYALAAVLFLAMTHAARSARATRTAGHRADALFFFLAGLAFLAHQTLAVPAAVLAAWVLGRGFTWARVGRAALASAVGLTPALVVPLRAASGASLLWKERGPWQAFADVFTRDVYGAVAQNAWRLDLVIADAAGMACGIATGAGVATLALAAIALVSRRRRLALLGGPAASAFAIPVTLAVVLVFTPDAEHMAQIQPFLLPAVAVTALAGGLGAAWLVSRTAARGFVRHAALAALVLVIGATVGAHAGRCDRSRFDLPERYGRELLASLPRGATLVVDGDNETFLAAYLTRHEGLRPDLTIVHRRSCVFGDANGLAGRPRAAWAARANEADLARIADPSRAVFFVNPPADLETSGVRFQVAGLATRAYPPRAPLAATWTPDAAWPRGTSLLGDEPARFDYVTRKIAISYADAAARAALERGDLDAAAAWYEDAAAVGFDMPETHWNLAVAAASTGNPDRALDALLAARSLAPTRAESASRLALFLVAAGRFGDAARWFERAYRDEPSAALAADAARAWSEAGEPVRANEWRTRAGRVG